MAGAHDNCSRFQGGEGLNFAKQSKFKTFFRFSWIVKMFGVRVCVCVCTNAVEIAARQERGGPRMTNVNWILDSPVFSPPHTPLLDPGTLWTWIRLQLLDHDAVAAAVGNYPPPSPRLAIQSNSSITGNYFPPSLVGAIDSCLPKRPSLSHFVTLVPKQQTNYSS